MLIVITSEKPTVAEAVISNELFDTGLGTLHLRIPHGSEADYSAFLDAINPQFHSRIVVHGQHHLGVKYKLKGVHYTEQVRRNSKNLAAEIFNFQKLGLTVSSSFHSVHEVVDQKFNYVFLSPVFDSISKLDYPGKKQNVKAIDSNIIGLGGINEKNIGQVRELGYKGAAVLGAIWKDKDPVRRFQNIQKSYYQHFQFKDQAIA